jgi:hypothetical protein
MSSLIEFCQRRNDYLSCANYFAGISAFLCLISYIFFILEKSFDSISSFLENGNEIVSFCSKFPSISLSNFLIDLKTFESNYEANQRQSLENFNEIDVTCFDSPINTLSPSNVSILTVSPSSFSPASPSTSLKRYAIFDHQSEFVAFGEFDIHKFTFPKMALGFEYLNSPTTDIQQLKSLDLESLMSKLATLIGKSIQGIFHMIPSNRVLQQISDQFKQSYPAVLANFELLKVTQDFAQQPNIKSYAHVGVSQSVYLIS